ncbi:MAG: hypothetical protein COS85_21845 [Armatimonadetes bacterium CG07_land_8_20_14_0_80_59_28]|nr:MAG: hypothetical protein COS85_21845 [Armatimonadetes bacterium CG07_land_8_20_14_0_80_59_28]
MHTLQLFYQGTFSEPCYCDDQREEAVPFSCNDASRWLGSGNLDNLLQNRLRVASTAVGVRGAALTWLSDAGAFDAERAIWLCE